MRHVDSKQKGTAMFTGKAACALAGVVIGSLGVSWLGAHESPPAAQERTDAEQTADNAMPSMSEQLKSKLRQTWNCRIQDDELRLTFDIAENIAPGESKFAHFYFDISSPLFGKKHLFVDFGHSISDLGRFSQRYSYKMLRESLELSSDVPGKVLVRYWGAMKHDGPYELLDERLLRAE